jgi:hypothetical protein
MARKEKEKERRIIVSDTRSGKVIKEKYGSSLLWRKEFHPEHRFFMLDVQKMICNNCNHLISLSEHRRVFVGFGVLEIQTLVCELCSHVNEYKFNEQSPEKIPVSSETKPRTTKQIRKP